MIFPTLDIELKLWQEGCRYVCGIDEVGRGCFAGPVVVGAVIFPQDVVLPEGIADSKLLKPQTRERLADEIKKAALYWGVAEIGVDVINNIGIGKATQRAFKKVVEDLEKFPDFILIDAFYIQDLDKGYQKPIVNGDKICASISAASIIAKVYRDDLMRQLHLEYPDYGFAEHKGYGTKKHQEAIKKHGLCRIHRKSFNLEKFLP